MWVRLKRALRSIFGGFVSSVEDPELILRQNLRFRGNISAGDRLTAMVKALEKRPEGHEVTFACRCVNQAGEELVTGKVVVAAPTSRLTYAEVAAMMHPHPTLSEGIGEAHLALAGKPLHSP